MMCLCLSLQVCKSGMAQARKIWWVQGLGFRLLWQGPLQGAEDYLLCTNLPSKPTHVISAWACL